LRKRNRIRGFTAQVKTSTTGCIRDKRPFFARAWAGTLEKVIKPFLGSFPLAPPRYQERLRKQVVMCPAFNPPKRSRGACAPRPAIAVTRGPLQTSPPTKDRPRQCLPRFPRGSLDSGGSTVSNSSGAQGLHARPPDTPADSAPGGRDAKRADRGFSGGPTWRF